MIELNEDQQGAVDKAMGKRLSIVTGHHGTGKTTLIRHLREELEARGETVELAAFAGKAAARMREATGFPASTIHRMLQWRGEFFMRKDLYGSAVILDEASMISSDLLYEVIRREPSRLILVGDYAQLPPVGKGQPFHDLITYRPELVSTLNICYRNSAAIYKAAMAIRAGQYPLHEEQAGGEKWMWKHTGGAARTHEYILGLVRDSRLDFSKDLLLVCRNGDTFNEPCTVKGLNKAIKDIVNPSEKRLAVGDRIINTKNFAECNVWNGTTGSVASIDHDGNIWMHLDDPITGDNGDLTHRVLFTRKMVPSLELAYAMTVHKSQGSQYRRVLFASFNRDIHSGLLDRSMAYTAVTRATEAAAVIGERQALVLGINAENKKRTVIQEIARTA